VHNWLANYLEGHCHCTRFNRQTSDVLEVNASIIQGSAIGPALYVVNAADMHTVTPGNSLGLMKYADDTYLVIPVGNVDNRDKVSANIDAWAKVNNLTLNASKSVEIVFQDSRKWHCAAPPPVMHGIECVHLLKILGITFTDKLSVKEHLDDVISSSARSMHAFRVLRSHGT